MKINNFNEKDLAKKDLMKKKLESKKLENIRSLWYFVTSSQKKSIAGSKG